MLDIPRKNQNIQKNSQKTTEPSMFGVLVQPNSIYCGIPLDRIEIPEKCALMGILRQGKLIPSEANPSIYSGDYILAIAIHAMMVPALKVTLKKTHTVYHSLDDCLLDSRLEFIKHFN